MRITRASLAIAVVLVVGLAASVAWADIKGSKHDLGSGGTGQGQSAVTSEVCVFCHTPHGSNTGVSAPLWNKVVALPAAYTRYSSLGSATLDGQEVDVGSVSLACLSCHDGTQAMDVVLNAPGSGGYNSGGAETDPAPGPIDAMTGSPVPNLGQDLRDDHPVSIAYAGGACTGVTASCDPSTRPVGDPDFRTATYAPINGKAWWVDTEVTPNGNRDKTDMILYTRDFGGGTNPGPAVECGSCHDPHNAASSGPASPSFMRIANTGSQVCLACHIK